MNKAPFFSVHKDFAQEGPIYGHDELVGLNEQAAHAQFHTWMASAWVSSDPWTMVYIDSDDGRRIKWDVIDRRTLPQVEMEV